MMVSILFLFNTWPLRSTQATFAPDDAACCGNGVDLHHCGRPTFGLVRCVAFSCGARRPLATRARRHAKRIEALRPFQRRYRSSPCSCSALQPLATRAHRDLKRNDAQRRPSRPGRFRTHSTCDEHRAQRPTSRPPTLMQISGAHWRRICFAIAAYTISGPSCD